MSGHSILGEETDHEEPRGAKGRAKGHKEPAGDTRGGQPGSPVGSATGAAVWLLAGDTSHSGAEPADPGLPRTPSGGPGCPALRPVTRQGTARTKDPRPATPTSVGTTARMGVNSQWPLGLRRRPGPLTGRVPLAAVGPFLPLSPRGAPSRENCVASPPRVSARCTGVLRCHNSTASVCTTPTQAVEDLANKGDFVGLLLILFYGGRG